MPPSQAEPSTEVQLYRALAENMRRALMPQWHAIMALYDLSRLLGRELPYHLADMDYLAIREGYCARLCVRVDLAPQQSPPVSEDGYIDLGPPPDPLPLPILLDQQIAAAARCLFYQSCPDQSRGIQWGTGWYSSVGVINGQFMVRIVVFPVGKPPVAAKE